MITEQPPKPKQAPSKYAVRAPHTGQMMEPPVGWELFEVKGAGWIAVSPFATAHCGGVIGCAIDPSWSRYGYSGGVMGCAEMRRLRDHLTALLGDNEPA